MGYQEFLVEFARAQGVGDVETLLSEHATRYSFQINSRERAKQAIALLGEELGIDWRGLRVLDVGCAYGSFAIELAHVGALPVGIDINKKWLRLAAVNARGEADVPFIDCDAAAFSAREALAPHGPFDLVLLNDVFEHIYDTAGLLANLRALMAARAAVYFRVPNGLAVGHILLEGHKRVFGISLLAPDYWSKFVATPFHIYYRRWPYFPAMFGAFGFEKPRLFYVGRRRKLERTRARIRDDLNKIHAHLADPAHFENAEQLAILRGACDYYFAEIGHDLATLDADALHFKYQMTFWTGFTRLTEQDSPR